MHIFVKSKCGPECIIPANCLRIYGDKKADDYRMFDGETSNYHTTISKKEYHRIKNILKQLNKEEIKKIAKEIKGKKVREQWKGQINALLGLEA